MRRIALVLIFLSATALFAQESLETSENELIIVDSDGHSITETDETQSAMPEDPELKKFEFKPENIGASFSVLGDSLFRITGEYELNNRFSASFSYGFSFFEARADLFGQKFTLHSLRLGALGYVWKSYDNDFRLAVDADFSYYFIISKSLWEELYPTSPSSSPCVSAGLAFEYKSYFIHIFYQYEFSGKVGGIYPTIGFIF